MSARSGSLKDAYAHWRASALGAVTERLEVGVVFDLAGDLDGKRVLDVGTGDGTYAIASARRGGAVTALDVDDEMIEAARARASARGVSLVASRARAEALPFEDASFDVVFAITVLCFVVDTPRALVELARVLAPGGRLVIGELGRASAWAAARRVRGWLGSPTWRRARFWSKRDLRALARGAGLTVIDVRGAVFYPPSALAAQLLAPVDPLLTRVGAPGAAFLALAARKPEGS